MGEPKQVDIQWGVLASACAALLALATFQQAAAGARGAGLVLAGAAGGFSLYHAAFGFAGGWKRFLTAGDARGIGAQLLLIALALPFGHALIAHQFAAGWVVPIGPALVAGAFLFGIGMQLAGGCGSGTLFTVGGGSSRMLLALSAFVAGSLIGTAPGLTAASWPRGPGLSLITLAGPLPAVLMAWVMLLTIWVAIRHRKPSVPLAAHPEGTRPAPVWLRGPWSRQAGAIALAGVAVATLVLAGRPWGITSAFALWGAKIAATAGIDIGSWPYWQGGRAGALAAPVLADVTSLMDLALIAGAMAAAGLAGRFRPRLHLGTREALTAVAGGLLMGYGARLSSGCNIGALLGGITSGSLHGWVWFAAAFAGSAAWLKLPPALARARAQKAPS